MEKVRVGYLLQGSVELEAADISLPKVLDSLKYDVPIKTLVDGVLTEHQGIDPEHIFLASIHQIDGCDNGKAIYDGITNQDVENLAAIAATNNHRAFRVWTKLTHALKEVILGKRDIETAFNEIDIRDCVKQHMIVPTTWHIDDLRDKVPYGTSDEELDELLRNMESSLSNAAVIAGNDVISDAFPEEVDNEVIIEAAWAIRDGDTYVDVYTNQEAALLEHPGEEIVKGYIVTGGSSIQPFLDKNFLVFYEDKRELMATILRFPDMSDLVNDLSICDGHVPSVEEVRVNGGMMCIGDRVFTISYCVGCKKDFVLPSNDNPAFDGPRVLEFDDTCDECLRIGNFS